MNKIILSILSNGYREAVKKFGQKAVDKVRNNPSYGQKLNKIKDKLFDKYGTFSMPKINRIKKIEKKANRVYGGTGAGVLGYFGYEYAKHQRDYPQTGKNLKK